MHTQWNSIPGKCSSMASVFNMIVLTTEWGTECAVLIYCIRMSKMRLFRLLKLKLIKPDMYFLQKMNKLIINLYPRNNKYDKKKLINPIVCIHIKAKRTLTRMAAIYTKLDEMWSTAACWKRKGSSYWTLASTLWKKFFQLYRYHKKINSFFSLQ